MNIVLVGIGGTGISSLAYIFKEIGLKNIIGIDKYQSQITDNLEKDGIKVIIGHGKYKIQNTDFVIYSDAALNSPEVEQSKDLSKNTNNRKIFHKPYSYFEFLGEISKYFKTISIAGTHGKSTTTSIAIHTLSKINKKFGIGILGALVSSFNNKNYLINQSIKNDIKNIFQHILSGNYTEFDHKIIKKYFFVIEADEFNRHFLHLDTDYSIILNTELDHSDVYKTFEEYFEAFEMFAKNTKKSVFGLKADKNLIRLKDKLGNKIKLVNQKKFNFKYIFGIHNQKNASLIYNLIKSISKINSKEIASNIESFGGLRRRMEFLGKNKNGCKIYSDYGHHPTEIGSTYLAFKEKFPKNKIISIFQPHQARRVIEFWNDFVNTTKSFDTNIIYNIYTARENLIELQNEFKNKDIKNISNIEELGKFFAKNSNGKYITQLNDIINIIENGKKDEIIVVFSAGDLDYNIRKIYKQQ